MTKTRERNLEALARLEPELARRLREPSNGTGVVVDESRSGHPSMKAVATDGHEIRLHSAYDPVKEAKQFVDQRKIPECEAYAVSGLGLGYHVREVLSRITDDTWLLLVEAKEELLHAAVDNVDLTPLLQRPRTRVFAGNDWVGFLGWLREVLEQSQVHQVTLLTYPPCVRLAPEFYDRVSTEMQNAVNRRMVEINTLVHTSETLEQNTIRNLAFLRDSLGVRDFEGAFAGVPAVVIAAGPSLSANVDRLKSLVGRAVFVSVGKSMKLLVENGIHPEYVTALDMTDEGASLLRGYDMPERTVLVYDHDSHHDGPRHFGGTRVSYETNSNVMKWAAGVFGAFGYLEKGLSVAHTAFYFARLLGCDPIVLVGVDLALAGERTHAEGVTMTWGGQLDEESKFNFIEIPSVTGKPVRSLKSFQSFVHAFEVEVAQTRSRVINTSPDGALIRGTENATLDQVTLGDPAVDISEVHDRFRSGRRDPVDFAKETGLLREGMSRLIETCTSGRRAWNRARRLDPANKLDAAEINKLGKRLEKARTDIIESVEGKMLNRLVSETALELRAMLKQKTFAGEKERIAHALRHCELLFDGYEAAAKRFLTWLEEMLGEIG